MNNKELETLMVCAFRYALGRKTGIVSDICEIIMKNIHELSVFSMTLIQREIADAIHGDQAGMQVDIQDWRILSQFIDKFLLSEEKHD